jgi:cell division protein FtsZ
VLGTGTDGIPAPMRPFDGSADYDIPTSFRINPRRSSAAVDAAAAQGIDTLDIPAFLRKQAD